ncbi:guanine nucleotide-binding protein-like 3 isoform X1 [Carcharodon carcharias]|uniref:guanine nucleotide-binding protein-like 3 isoform X1 n=1 Tax=Carcharodon carcharias TaxID=13397 RepID=UPI001B7E8647|nr:guanine nucleotide-binding protein-like 3 isoform X1 [Carcharodon carcharias]
MKRPKLKKASKRLTCHKRFKIQRKVREHKRKVRKEAKKQGNKGKKSRKDPGVPNSAPFKEAILREAEQRKQNLEELKQKQKLARQKEVAKKRKLEASKDPEINEKQLKRTALKQQKKVDKLEGKSPRKSVCSELNKVLDASDVVLEVVDARDPLGYRCPQVEQAVLQSEGKKQLVLVLNKIDLVPKENAGKWLQYLENEFPVVVFKSSTQLQDRTMEQKKISKLNNSIEISHSNTCVGGESLLKLLGSYCRKQDLKSIKVGVVGFPNVGKSSIINSLKKMRACNVGQIRGLTKSMQEVHVDKQIKVLDSPSIIASSSNSAVALSLRNIVDIEALENPSSVVEPILKNCNKQQVMLQYNIPDFRTSLEFLTLLARKRSMLKKGGIPDIEKAAKLILYDWTGAKVSYHTHPPERHKLPIYITGNLVEEARRGFNAEELTKSNENTLKAVRCPNLASSIVFQSTGPTNGLIKEDNMEEEMHDQEINEEDADDRSVGRENLEAEYIEIDKNENLKADGCSIAKMLQVKQMEVSSKKRQLESEKIADPNQKPISVDLSCEKPMEDAYDFNTDYIEDLSPVPISSL